MVQKEEWSKDAHYYLFKNFINVYNCIEDELGNI
jgi:hypothetical protein